MVEALRKFDEAQTLITKHFNDNLPELQTVCDEISIICNVLAMTHL